MKLKRLKLLSEFRGLPNNFEIKFNDFEGNNFNNIEPICFVGLNGSGKSNVLEVLTEIFFYLERYHLATKEELQEEEKEIKKKSNSLIDNKFDYKYFTPFGFEIEYSISYETFNMPRIPWPELNNEWNNSIADPIFCITKGTDKIPSITASIDNKLFQLENNNYNRNIGVLPSHIIGYSSGMNELISNPFLKMDLAYFDDFKDKSGDSSFPILDYNRLFFMDYDSNKTVTICDFLFDKEAYKEKELVSQKSSVEDFGAKDVSTLIKQINILDLHSFSIQLKFYKNKRDPIKIPPELHLTINSLKKCATCINDNTNYNSDPKVYDIELFYWVNKATKQAFIEHFNNAQELYRKLYFLKLLNYNLVSTELRNKIKNAKRGLNISALLPKHEENRLNIFHK